MQYRFSNKISALKPSAIREILKAASVPGLISFAAGNPAAEAFPVDEIRQITAQILAEQPINALQYGVTEGYEPLIAAVRGWVGRYGVGNERDSLIITSGAQQVMDLVCKVLCDEGDTVLCENPSFIGSLNSFRAYNANLVGIPIEADGLNIAALEDALKREKNVRFLYTIPNFQNPTGATMSAEKRRAVYALAQQYDLIILEDNPYGDLRVVGEALPAIKTLDTDGRVIYAGSFSKILSPGLRAGFCVGPPEILAKMTVGKQTGDVHTSMLTQMIVYQWLTGYDVPAHIAKIQGIYRRKLNLMCDLLDEKLADHFHFVRPEGGLFVWGTLGYAQTLGARAATDKMLRFCKTCTDHGVAVVPGSAFLTDPNGTTDCIRLNFSTPSDENIVKGIDILRSVAAGAQRAEVRGQKTDS
ncbi:MAG: PLP-dependent aminotransferase family protein [Oscillospiraceae bacterium]|jgi:2-aminoadipate transaminase|nr:PLP-dependent aminotransferase family protein [Oscillospiraceae bacterium]